MSEVIPEEGENEEYRPWYGSVKPKKHEGDGVRYRTIHPLTQANFVVGFTIFTMGTYSMALYLFDQRKFLPPNIFYWSFIAMLALLWGSLYIEYFPVLTKRLANIFNIIVNYLVQKAISTVSRRSEDKTLAKEEKKTVVTEEEDEEKKGSNLEVTAQPDEDNWRAPAIEELADTSTYDPGVVIRVYLLVATTSFWSCLFSMYSGGPFQSAYSQIIIAYPLFATGFARRWWSLIAVYLMTIVFAGIFELTRLFGYFRSYPTQSSGWYAAVTAILLLISLLVALIHLNAERDHDRESANMGR